MAGTDSLVYEIEANDSCKYIKDDIQYISFHDISEHPKYLLAISVGFKVLMNKNVVVVMKDETSGTEISKFFGVRSKCNVHSMSTRKTLSNAKVRRKE